MRKKTKTKAKSSAVKKPGTGKKTPLKLSRGQKNVHKKAVKEVEADLPPHVHAGASPPVFAVANPGSYQRLVGRLQESANRRSDGKPEEGRLIETEWACALCRGKTCRDNLGDLFGPHYLILEAGTLWPPFLGKPKKSKAKEAVYTELWLHGDCALWAPGLLLKGPRLVGLSDHLPEFWDQVLTPPPTGTAPSGPPASSSRAPASSASPTTYPSSGIRYSLPHPWGLRPLGPRPPPQGPPPRRPLRPPTRVLGSGTHFPTHGDCALWAPGLLLKGPRLVGLSDHLPEFWDQACSYCSETGASINCSVNGCTKVFHFPCGVQKKCYFREESLASYCTSHVSIGKKKDAKQAPRDHSLLQ